MIENLLIKIKKVIFFLIILFSLQYYCDSVNEPNKTKTNVLEGNISYRSIIHSRAFIRKSNQTQLIVMRSIEDKNTFIDTTHTASNYMGLSSFEDSMLVGIIYGEEISVSVTFSIDSVIADPSLQEITIHSHLFIPGGKLIINGFHSHFIALPKSDYRIAMNDVDIIYEPPPSGKIIPFKLLFYFNHALRNDTSDPNLIVLRTKQDEISFLDSTETYSNFDFPLFTYTDSMLVGVLYPHEGSPNPVQIISVISENDTVQVNTQHWINLLSAGYSNPGYPCYFVSLSNEYANLTFILNDTGYIISEIED